MANSKSALRTELTVRISGAVVVFYLLACFLPCVDCGPAVAYGDLDFHVLDRGHHYGLEILLYGWTGGNNGVSWSANVFLLLGLFCLWTQRLRGAVAMGAIASVLGLTTWWVRRYDTLMVGYYLWQTSQFVLVGGSLWAIYRSGRHPVAASLWPGADERLYQDESKAF